MGKCDELLERITRALDRRRREIDGDTGLRTLKIILRKLDENGSWVTTIEKVSQDPLDRN